MYKICNETSNYFNAAKSQLLYLLSNTTSVPKDIMFLMESGKVILYTYICNYLGIIICSHDEMS